MAGTAEQAMRFSVTSIVATSFVVLAIAGSNPVPLQANDPNDGWRRSARGWEYMESEATPAPYFLTESPTTANPRTALASPLASGRLDTHPAALIAFQLIAAGFGFLLFPQQSRIGANARTFPVGKEPRWHSPAWIF